MNRLFFVTEKKISSLSFPFNAEQLPGGSVRLRSQSGIEIDSLNSSQVIALLSESSLARNPSHTALAEALIDAHSDSDAPSILVELLLWEEGYIRYDWDTGRADAALHPEHHIDVFHSSPSSFKIGLDNRIRVEELIDIMEIESSCRYLR
jgi:hypothetical protein